MITAETERTIKAAARRGLSVAKKPEPLWLDEWIERFFYLSPESSYVEGRMQLLPFQRPIAQIIGCDDIREVWLRKAARLGYTKLAVAACQYFAEHKKRNTAIWQPTDDDRDEFTKTEIDTAIRDNPRFRAVFPAYGKKSPHNTIQLKQGLGWSLHLRGGKAAKNYRRLSVDTSIIDELEGFDHDIEKEGSPVQLAARRCQNASFPKLIVGSTPKLKEFSMIEAGIQGCEYVLRWHIDCPSCSHSQELVWGGTELEGGIKWDGKDAETAAGTTRYRCESCHHEWSHSEYGKHIAKGGRYVDPDKGVYWSVQDRCFKRLDNNERAPFPRRVGFTVWSGVNDMVDWSEIVREWHDTKGHKEQLQGFVNLTLGESWELQDSEKIDYDVLHSTRRRPYEWECPTEVNAITFGIDHQDDRFELGWCGWGEGEECWHLAYQVIEGDLARPTVWELLEQAIRRTFRKKDGTIMQSVLGCIDHGGHYSKEVSRISKKQPLYLIPTKGRSTYGQQIVHMPRQRNDAGVFLSLIGTDTAKDLLYRRLQITDPGPGFIHWPQTDDFGVEYFQQFAGEVRKPKIVGGRKRWVWVKRRARNEAWDVAVLNLAAIHIAQQRFGLSLDKPMAIPGPAAQIQAKPKTEGYLGRHRGYLER